MAGQEINIEKREPVTNPKLVENLEKPVPTSLKLIGGQEKRIDSGEKIIPGEASKETSEARRD